MKYEVYGPCFLTQKANGTIPRVVHRKKGNFFKTMEDQREGLSKAFGCYVFCTQWGEKLKPWYVGQTKGKGGLFFESTHATKIAGYNEIFSDFKNYPTACLLYVARLTPRGKFAKANTTEFDWLEKFLITQALDENPELLNVKHTKLLRRILIPGVLGSRTKNGTGGQGNYSSAQKSLRLALGVA